MIFIIFALIALFFGLKMGLMFVLYSILGAFLVISILVLLISLFWAVFK